MSGPLRGDFFFDLHCRAITYTGVQLSKDYWHEVFYNSDAVQSTLSEYCIGKAL